MQPDKRAACPTKRKGRYPGEEDEMVFMIPIVGIVTVFAFTAIVHWVNSQRQEREAFYKAETLRRITEASGEGAKAALELLRTDERLKQFKKHEGMKIGGLINIGLGIGMAIFLWGVMRGMDSGAPYLAGLIPALIGVAMLVYVYLLAGSIE